MLIQFAIKNYKTFKEKATLSLVASNYDQKTREAENVIADDKYNLRILKSAVIYGANASGKSKFIDALATMRYFTMNSSKDSQKGDEIDVDPFRLSTETEKAPSEFEVIFTYNGAIYRYGFEADRKKIVSEWLYYKPKTKEIEIFFRDGQKFETHSSHFDKGNFVIKEDMVRDNALLLSVAAQFNDIISIEVMDWFRNLKPILGLESEKYRGSSFKKIDDPMQKLQILEFLKAADMGIEDILLQKLDIEQLPKSLPKKLKDRIIKDVSENNAKIITDVLTTHKKYDVFKKIAGTEQFSMDDDESAGTNKFFSLAGPILDALEKGYTLVIDELDSRLHPNLVCKIVSLFNTEEFNPNNAQLIFNTHDTNLLDSGLFRRDQIWLTAKNEYGEANLYSLSDFKSDKVRKKENFEENYVRGKYGAIPFLGFFDDFAKNLNQSESPNENSTNIL